MALGRKTLGRIAQVLVAAGISVGLVWYVWSQVEMARLVELLGAVPGDMLVAMLAVYFGFQVLRAWRFSIIFPSAARGFTGLIATVCVQGAIAVVLPLWLGEVAIVALLRHRHAVKVGSGTAAALLARSVDLLLQAVLFVAALVIYRDLIPKEVFRFAGVLIGILALPVLLVAALLVARRQLESNVRGWVSEHLALAATATDEMLERHVLLPFLVVTGLMWTAMFLFFHLVLVGLSVPGGVNSTWFVYSMLVPVGSIPIKGIADFGTHEAAWYVLLRLLNLGSEEAANVAFGSHALILMSVGVTFTIGLTGLWIGRSKPVRMP